MKWEGVRENYTWVVKSWEVFVQPLKEALTKAKGKGLLGFDSGRQLKGVPYQNQFWGEISQWHQHIQFITLGSLDQQRDKHFKVFTKAAAKIEIWVTKLTSSTTTQVKCNGLFCTLWKGKQKGWYGTETSKQLVWPSFPKEKEDLYTHRKATLVVTSSQVWHWNLGCLYF